MSCLSCLPSSSATASLSVLLVVVVCANLLVLVENKSFFGIGTRVFGDQLLLKDILQTPPISLTEEPVIKFQYAIEEPITYLAIESDKSVFAKINFSYELNLVEGIISSINSTFLRPGRPQPYQVLIQIYGFNDTNRNINSAHILNKDQHFNGVLKPIYRNKIDQSFSPTEEDLKMLNDLDLDYDDDDEDFGEEEHNDYEVETDDEDGDGDGDGDGDDYFNSTYDKIIEQGYRQEGDFLVYENNQTSAVATKLPTNHSVIFYYVDIYYITYVKFIIYEHYLYHPLNNYENTYVIEYAQISPTTLKAIVTDLSTTSLFVQMQMYGFHPTALPVDYKPFLSNSQTSAATKPISSLTQLKILMNAQQSAAKQQQPEQNNSSTDLQQQAAELGHIKSPYNKSDINCTQQVSNAQRIFTTRSIFNSIVIFFMTLMVSRV